ncbi:unnamed protein product [Closterium sp. Naga37s-1]|nr:unnamed protein product [Closterium sp. Naga37s-1]
MRVSFPEMLSPYFFHRSSRPLHSFHLLPAFLPHPIPPHSTLDSQKLSGILHADITKLTALTFILFDFNCGMSYNYLTYRVPPLAAGLLYIDVGFNLLSGPFPVNTATSCGASNNCFQNVTTGTAQRSTGCKFCNSATGQGMLCYGSGVCTVDASAPFNAGTPNAVGAATLPLACVRKCRVHRGGSAATGTHTLLLCRPATAVALSACNSCCSVGLQQLLLCRPATAVALSACYSCCSVGLLQLLLYRLLQLLLCQPATAVALSACYLL